MKQVCSVKIRPVRPQDVSRVWEMVGVLAAYERLEHELAGSEAGLQKALFGSPRRLEGLVAERDDRLVGYALVYEVYSSFHTREALWLEDLFVEESSRGAGVGRALLREVARLALARGCPRVGWLVLDWNKPSIRFYERVGARPTSDRWLIYGLDPDGLRALADSSDRA